MITTDVSLEIPLKVQTMWLNRNNFIAYGLPKTICKKKIKEKNIEGKKTLSETMDCLRVWGM